MDKHDWGSRVVRVGLVLLTLLASLVVTTHLVPIAHAAPPTHVPLTQYAQLPATWVGKLFITYTKDGQGCIKADQEEMYWDGTEQSQWEHGGYCGSLFL